MNINENIFNAVKAESYRIEEDALHSMKGHFNAASFWDKVNFSLGTPSVILAGGAGIAAFFNNSALTAIFAFLSGSLTATMTFLTPQKTADNHRNAGREYNVLKNSVRQFREIEAPTLGEGDLTQMIKAFATKINELNSMSPDIPRWAYEKARKDIDKGTAEYKVDRR